MKESNAIVTRVEFCRPNFQYHQQETGTRFVQVQSSPPIDVQHLTGIQILDKQAHGAIGDDLLYDVMIDTNPQHPSYDEKVRIESLNVRIQVDGQEVALQNITLEANHDFFLHQTKKAIRDETAVNNDHIMLYLSAQKNGLHSTEQAFSFDGPTLRTFIFTPAKKPAVRRLLCWRGYHAQPLLPVYISERVLAEFQKRAVQNHPNEIGAQLGGVLGQDKDFKFLKITDIEFFENVGNEVELNLPAAEMIKIAQNFQQKNLHIAGWLHSHGFGKNALYCSTTDIYHNYERNTNPFAIMLIADSTQLSGQTEPMTCNQCPGKSWCRFKPEEDAVMAPGWSAYGWALNGSISSMPLLVFNEEE
jgi:proteasome lid subunit RPN8/RPN11